MGRRPIVSNVSHWASMTLLFLGIVACTVAFMAVSTVFKPINNGSPISDSDVELVSKEIENGNVNGGCCRGIPNLELWGSAVKWGTDHKFNSSEDCCQACKAMCIGNDGPCLCDSWVFCGDRKVCGSRFGECWLKKQKDTLAPERHDTGSNVMWTSGLIFGKREGIIGLETEHGCLFYRAEGRGDSWDVKGNHIKDASFGPPFALIQGTLEAAGVSFKTIPTEDCRTIRRGSVAWVGSGPEFFISLADHREWRKTYTVFGSVLPEDMEIAEEIAQLPTKPDVWSNVSVSVLENPVPILIHGVTTNNEDLTHKL